MKVSLTLNNFPMLLYDMFTEDLAKYVNANVQVDDIDTVSVNFEADGVKAQEAIIICDKYSFTKGGDFNEKREEA